MKAKKLISLILLLTLVSCSTSRKDNDYVLVEKNAAGEEINVEYAGQCALAVSQGQFKTKGKKMFKHETNSGKIYYFADKNAKNKFLKSRSRFESMADENWEKFLRGRGDGV